MGNLKIFSARACPFAHRTRLVLGHKGIEFELVEIDLQNKPSWFSDVSLYGKVPALEHDGHRIVESAIINEYIEERFPDPPLLPRDPALRALARIWIDFANTRLAPAYGKLLRGATDVEREGGRRELSDALARVEHEGLAKLSKEDGPFWFGASPSLVDFSFYPWFERLPALQHYYRFGVPQELTRLLRWRDAVQALPISRAIANPKEFYIERYRAYVPAQVLAAS